MGFRKLLSTVEVHKYPLAEKMSIKTLLALVCFVAASCKSQKVLPSEDPEEYNLADLADLAAQVSITDDEMETNARRAGCTRGCLICLSKIKCTAKMKTFIPGRCHTYEGDKASGQAGIGGPIVDIPEIPGFKELEPMEQFIAQVDLCEDCTTGCLKGLANVRCNDLLKKWLPDRCAGFANKIQGQVDNIKGMAGDR